LLIYKLFKDKHNAILECQNFEKKDIYDCLVIRTENL